MKLTAAKRLAPARVSTISAGESRLAGIAASTRSPAVIPVKVRLTRTLTGMTFGSRLNDLDPSSVGSVSWVKTHDTEGQRVWHPKKATSAGRNHALPRGGARLRLRRCSSTGIPEIGR